jgi:hypothetical protein
MTQPNEKGNDMTDNAVQIHEARAELPADPMVSMIERVAMDPNSDLAKLEKMLELKERHDAQNAKAAFDAAFSKASAEFPDIPLNGENKHQKTRYALLKDILSGVRPILSRHGLALSFSTEVSADFVTVTAELSHESGHSKRNSIPLPRDTGAGRNAVQAVGSSQTYGQRYTAQAILGLSLGEDTEDDGAAATGNVVSPEQYIALRDRAMEAGVDEKKICMAHGVSDLTQFPVKDFDTAMARLQQDMDEKQNG